jgi:hypothetical protein
MGCSEQFASLFDISAPSNNNYTRLFDRDFVLAALAFLCSRLLGATKVARASVTIQKAWRSYWRRVTSPRREQLKAVALGCAEKAKTRTESKPDLLPKHKLSPTPKLTSSDGTSQGLMSPTRTEDGDIWLNL